MSLLDKLTAAGANLHKLVVMAWDPVNDAPAQLNAIAGQLQTTEEFDYEAVAASATNQIMGATGAAGDLLSRIAIATSTGTITIKDNTTTILTIPAGATGVWVLNLKSKLGGWSITTAASTSCLAIGRFT